MGSRPRELGRAAAVVSSSRGRWHWGHCQWSGAGTGLLAVWLVALGTDTTVLSSQTATLAPHGLLRPVPSACLPCWCHSFSRGKLAQVEPCHVACTLIPPCLAAWPAGGLTLVFLAFPDLVLHQGPVRGSGLDADLG